MYMKMLQACVSNLPDVSHGASFNALPIRSIFPNSKPEGGPQHNKVSNSSN